MESPNNADGYSHQFGYYRLAMSTGVSFIAGTSEFYIVECLKKFYISTRNDLIRFDQRGHDSVASAMVHAMRLTTCEFSIERLKCEVHQDQSGPLFL